MIRDAEFWNNKWQQAAITYGGRALRGSTERILCDVKGFVTTNDAFLSEIIRDYQLEKYSPNETVHEVQNFVVRFLDYVGDDESSECSEFWQFPFETLQSNIGDCEDGAILMASLMIQAGVPAHRIKVCAGFVQESPTAPEGGHAYCIYLADRGWDEQEWVVIDWCYYEDSDTPPENKPLATDGGYGGFYKDIWFTFNSEFSWNQGSLEIDSWRISRNRSDSPKKEISNEMTLESVMKKIKSKVKK
jgi:hypothetical protein